MRPTTGHPRAGVPPQIPLGLALALSAGLVRGALAAMIEVPGDQPTVRAAVNAAAHGDVILIAPGTHPGGAFIDGKAITLASWYLITGDTSYVAQTVLQGVAGNVCGGAPGCLGNAVVEYGANGAALASRLIGLTLTGGENGVASSSNVEMSWCRIVGNGDGVDFVAGSGGMFEHSLFANNSDDGIDLNGHMNLTIRDNVVRDNLDDGIEYRVHEYVGTPKLVDIRRNRITGNGEDGIQLIDYPGAADMVIRIEENLFQSNFDGSGSSAAVGCMPNGNTVENLVGAPMVERVYLVHNTFIGERYGFVGGGNVIALNNIFTGIQMSALRRLAGTSIASYSMFWNNGIDYEDSIVDLPHMLHADPQLTPNGGLPTGSPAIDAGTAFFTWQGDTVLYISPQVYLGAAPDLGAFQYVPNLPPLVDAGPDRTVILPATAHLSALVTDDGRPVPEGWIVTQWSACSGPGPVTLDPPSGPSVQATFTVEGVYLLCVTANDGELTSADTVQVTVLTSAPFVERRILVAGDDVEEDINGLLSSDTAALDLGQLASDQTVGLRFDDLTIPRGAAIAHAYVQFVTALPQSGVSQLLIRAQAADDAPPFGTAFTEVSSRPGTGAVVGWFPMSWDLVGEAGPRQRTPDLSGILHEVVARPGWVSGNALVIMITGTGRRAARSFEASPGGAALLHVELAAETVDVEVTSRLELALRRVGPHPARGSVGVELTLPNRGPATLSLLDVAGRLVVTRELSPSGAGSQHVDLGSGLEAGIYFVRLVQSDRSVVMKAIVLE